MKYLYPRPLPPFPFPCTSNENIVRGVFLVPTSVSCTIPGRCGIRSSEAADLPTDEGLVFETYEVTAIDFVRDPKLRVVETDFEEE